MQAEFPRLNTYKFQANCVDPGFIKNYCVCKDFVE